MQQGSEKVSSSHSSAFPIAAVITGIWSSYPDVGDLILAQFYDQCPFLVPFYIPRAAELSDAEYFASLSYQCSEGEIEEQDKFLKVTVDLQGCLPKNHSYARRLCYNHRKVYITVKLIKCKIRRNKHF